jgi:hypothetical protein
MNEVIAVVMLIYIIGGALIAGLWYQDYIIRWIVSKYQENKTNNDATNSIASVITGILVYSIVSEIMDDIERENSLWYKIKKRLFDIKNEEDDDIDEDTDNEENAVK